MKIIYSGKNNKIEECVDFANELFNIDEFWQEINSVDKFSHTKLTPVEISKRISECDSQVKIRLYRPLWPFSKANAYVTSKYPNMLFLNSRKTWRSYASIINTIFHECVHIADYGDDDSIISFGHGSNSPVGKKMSAPYWIGDKAGEFFEKGKNVEAEIEKIDIDEDLIID